MGRSLRAGRDVSLLRRELSQDQQVFLSAGSCSPRAWTGPVHHQAEVLPDRGVPSTRRGSASSFRGSYSNDCVWGWGKVGLLFEIFVSPPQPPGSGAPQMHNTLVNSISPPPLQVLRPQKASAISAGGWAGPGCFPPSSKMAATASVTGLITWAPPPMRSPRLRRRLSLPGPRPEEATALVNRSLSDHGNGLGRGARGSGGSLVAGRGGGAAAAAVALALAPALSAMQRGSSEKELAAGWAAEAVAVAEAPAAAAAEQVGVDSGAAGEPERKAREKQPKERARAQPRAAEEGDARVVPRPAPTLPLAKPQPARARGLCPHRKPRSKGRGCRRSSGRSADEYCSQRPVTVDSSKARTSLDALKISIRQLKWKEVRPGPAAWARREGGPFDLGGPAAAQARAEG